MKQCRSFQENNCHNFEGFKDIITRIHDAFPLLVASLLLHAAIAHKPIFFHVIFMMTILRSAGPGANHALLNVGKAVLVGIELKDLGQRHMVLLLE